MFCKRVCGEIVTVQLESLNYVCVNPQTLSWPTMYAHMLKIFQMAIVFCLTLFIQVYVLVLRVFVCYQVMIVLEFMEKGDLQKFLRKDAAQ